MFPVVSAQSPSLFVESITRVDPSLSPPVYQPIEDLAPGATGPIQLMGRIYRPGVGRLCQSQSTFAALPTDFPSPSVT